MSEADPAARAVLAGGLAVAHALLAAYQGGVLLSSAQGTVEPLRLALHGVTGSALVPGE